MANNVLKLTSGDFDAKIDVMITPEYQNPKLNDDFNEIISQLFPTYILIMYIPIFYNTVYNIVKEKECRVRESMKMMGLTDTPYWFSWFFHYTVINFFMCFLAWFFLCGSVIEYSAKFEVWVMMFMYGEAIFGQIIIVGALFNKAKFSGLVGTVLYYIFFFFNFFLTSASTTYSEKIWWSVFPQVAVNNMAQVYAALESA